MALVLLLRVNSGQMCGMVRLLWLNLVDFASFASIIMLLNLIPWAYGDFLGWISGNGFCVVVLAEILILSWICFPGVMSKEYFDSFAMINCLLSFQKDFYSLINLYCYSNKFAWALTLSTILFILFKGLHYSRWSIELSYICSELDSSNSHFTKFGFFFRISKSLFHFSSSSLQFIFEENIKLINK